MDLPKIPEKYVSDYILIIIILVITEGKLFDLTSRLTIL